LRGYLPPDVVARAVGRQSFGTVPVTREILGEQQRIADTFTELGLIPRPIDVLKAAPPDLA
jgi:sulfonate transport system substrate-binding protein